MRKIQLSSPGGLENLRLTNSKKPIPIGDQVLIKVSASSLNFHDLLVALGNIPTDDGRVVLSDCAGEVVEIGPETTRWRVGDRVISCCYPHWIDGEPEYRLMSFIGDNEDGYATEYIAISEKSVTAMPNG
ncbi:MAG: NAD(P)-dependent alcohol dehydrogenase, partial [Porticoccaceae bacterium]|nr:NAD(P)-dependent alcohol dehydrogenase [Porticoccaceae bacterium]